MNHVAVIAVCCFLLATPLRAADYLRDVKPLLEHKCYACHGAIKQQAGLRLDTARALKRGGESGSPVSIGEPNASLLIDVLTGAAGFRMPPDNEGAPLTPAEIELIRQWIAAGAPEPAEEEPQVDPRTWWSYRRLERPAIPQVAQDDWCRNPIDYFVAAQREHRQLPHAPEAPKTVWLRRVYLDLIGLPPTRAELQRFLADSSDQAYETVVDDLLARPQYGERWGRHWMDIWRYSDWYGSRGINEIRYSQRHIWRWRDWIIASLNQDRGYDQMIREMLAADEIAPHDPGTVAATGYLGRNWYKFDRDVWLFETVERTGEAFLGLTLRCARCHDHKFDPVSQEEYYRFRAFFEPHHVRTDPISALTPTQKDATLGQVLTDGIARVYDKELEAATYCFERGDSRYPDKTRPLEPGVPAALGGDPLQVTSIDLPVEAWYPLLRPGIRESVLQKAEQEIAEAEKRLRDAQQAVVTAQEKLKAAQTATGSSTEPRIHLHDDFSRARPDIWSIASGTWVYEDKRLVQSAVTSFATMVTKQNHPSDFHVQLRYRARESGTYRSVGFSFDYQDQGNSQDVYTSTNDTNPSVQAFHRVGGKQVYPPAGIVRTPLKVGEEVTLDIDVFGSRLTIDLNGERKLEYTLPVARRDGKLALWVHQGSAEFLELKITEHAESPETLARRVQEAERAVIRIRSDVHLARTQHASVERRLQAELARYLQSDAERTPKLAREASAAELQLAVVQAELELAKLHDVENPSADVQNQLAEAQKKLQAAQEAAANPTEKYTPLGDQYPRTSTGRRSALAAWIASPSNPRTARVAANHLWGRHFGRPLVATPENFGPNGRKPTHPELLDWLASELIAQNWKMKPLHRLIVLSSTYRMTSQAAGAEAALAADPDNQFLWRMPSRRMEAEVVRDSTLYLAQRLDLRQGGAEIPETSGETVLRRSLYFRNTPNEKMLALEVFDVADPNSCYRRKESVVPHQSLAMMNSGLTLDHARIIAGQLQGTDAEFIDSAFETILTRLPTDEERERCRQFLQEMSRSFEPNSAAFPTGGSARRAPSSNRQQRARENLVHVLLLHNDYVTIR